MNICQRDGVEAARSLSGIKLRKADTVLIIASENVGDGDVSDLVIHRQKAHGAVAVFREKPVDLNVGNIAARALVRVQRNQIVVARALEVSEHAVVAVSVKVDTVHIRGDRISEIEIKNDVFDREVRARVDHNGVIGRILDRQIGDAEALHVIEKHRVTKIAVLLKLPRVDRVLPLIHIIEIPDSALDLEIVTGMLRIGRKQIVKTPQALAFLAQKFAKALFGESYDEENTSATLGSSASVAQVENSGMFGAGMNLAERPTFYFIAAEGYEDQTPVFTIGEREVAYETETIDAKVYYLLAISPIELTETVRWTIGDKSGAFNLRAYYDWAKDEAQNAALAHLVERLYRYAESVQNYFN